jgi:Leucine-rich repeat (LRR) protein
VTEISLPSNGLRGLIPSVIYHLPELKKLDVRQNDVTILFGAMHQATSLEQLYLDETRVSRLDGIGQAASLKTLHIKRANFGWQTIPGDVFDLAALTDLDLSESMFGGTLSTRIGDMVSLERLALLGNAISGQIPSDIGQLASLKDLELSNNNWFGTLPSTFSDLTSLEGIFLDNTEGTSSGISGPLQPFATMPQISEIHLSNNQLTGTIPEDFLAGVSDPDSVINISLDGNHLIGTVSAQLGAFSKLNIELADNLFVALGDGLCDESSWLDGDVGQYGCAGILCPAGTFSSKGRQASNDEACETCPGDENSPYLGVSVCIALQKQIERDVLGILFEATGGSNWKNKDGWMDDAVDICEWYGISCQPGSTVESILLGSNHLVGTVPTEIYQLPNLKFLWMYSNPIDMSFDGIEQATRLQSLAIDSTQLRSLNGIGRARSLIDVDVRFNRLTGPIPSEIGDLVNLESFTCSENEFSGSIPNLTALRKLNTLRMSNNKFTGSVHSFAGNPQLKELDLSKNRLTGSIPIELLQTANLEQSVFLDLSENLITGTVPGELSRFTDLTIYLRDNRIGGIDPALCTLELWNGGDVGAFECDGILCPSGTVSPTGRASKTNGITCEPCAKNKYFGSTVCGFSAAPAGLRALIPLSLTILSIIGLLI